MKRFRTLRNWLCALSPWKVAFLFVFGLAVFTRLYQLGSMPQGMTWDEAALGYVGKMVITTGRDEHSNLIPITFQSFGDYKAPLAFYIIGVSTTLFGITPFATRLPYALAGIVSILLIIALCSRLTRNAWYGLLAGFLLTISPWHLLFSHVGFEAGLSLCFFLLMLTGWVWWHEDTRWKHLSLLGMVMGAEGFLYSYHAAKIVFPLVLLTLLFLDWRRGRTFVKKHWRTWVALVLAIGVLSLPLVFEMILGPGLARAGQTSFLGQVGWGEALVTVLKNLGIHLSPAFLVQGETTTLRHGFGSLGVLLYSQFALLLLGITFAVGRLAERLYSRHQVWHQKLVHWLGFESQFVPQSTPSWFWLVLLPITLLPALIGNEVPHANRAFLALIPIIVLIVLGLRELQSEISHQAFASIAGTLLLLMTLEFASFWRFYTDEYPVLSGEAWMEGYQSAVQQAGEYVSAHKRVKFTTEYGEPQIFYAFFNKLPFEVYRNARVPDVEFGTISPDDLVSSYDVLIASPEERLPIPETGVISRTDGSPAFLIYELQ